MWILIGIKRQHHNIKFMNFQIWPSEPILGSHLLLMLNVVYNLHFFLHLFLYFFSLKSTKHLPQTNWLNWNFSTIELFQWLNEEREKKTRVEWIEKNRTRSRKWIMFDKNWMRVWDKTNILCINYKRTLVYIVYTFGCENSQFV